MIRSTRDALSGRIRWIENPIDHVNGPVGGQYIGDDDLGLTTHTETKEDIAADHVDAQVLSVEHIGSGPVIGCHIRCPQITAENVKSQRIDQGCSGVL